MKKYGLLILCCLMFFTDRLSAANNFNLMIAPASLAENAVTLIWDKQELKTPGQYEILLNGKKYLRTVKTNCTITGLSPGTKYKVTLRYLQTGKQKNKKTETLKFRTAAKGMSYNVLDFGAIGDGATMNTSAIQKAIDACTAGGTVYIPDGKFLSGALFLKSDMTLLIEKGGILQGSDQPEDYLPMILNRFEGWELKTYASLLNAGTLNRDGSYNVFNLRITGRGTVAGAGKKLGEAMIKANGIRSRGRLICLMNCQDVSISYLTLTEPPCWTLHYIYSDNVSCYNLNIVTLNIRNGDGIDPDSSTDSYIFNCVFDTGDDCIAIKSGKNPEGYFIAKPTKNVRITNCDFIRGHGISIGSEMSGGVSNVLVQDCKAGALLNGMQIKGTKDRGGYVKNVTVQDCQLLKITVFTSLSYNNDGEPAPVLPDFENFLFEHIDLSGAITNEPVIQLNGFNDPAHKLKQVVFRHVLVPENAKIVINDAEKINFEDVKTNTGSSPVYKITNSAGITYD